MSNGGGHELNWDDPIGPAQPDQDKLANFYNIPAELRELNQWVLWRLDPERGKIPYQANGRKASSTDPKTWTSFDKAIKAYKTGKYSGLGFVFANDYVGVDLDHMAPGGQLNPEARQILTNLDTYTEYSQSGEGIHAITRGQLPADPRRITKNPDGTEKEQGGIKRGNYELYQNGRYFALTGNLVPGYKASIEDRPEQISKLYFKIWPLEDQQPRQATPSSLSLTDQDIISKAMGAKNAFAFNDLYNGNTDRYGSQSEADLALCSLIAFYTQDPQQIDRIFRASGLYRDKWNREDYRRDTISKAIKGLQNTYQPPREDSPPSQPSTSNTPKPPGEGQPPNTQQEQDQPEAREAYLKSSAAHHLQDFIDGIRASVDTPYIPTGFDKLDNILDGGLYEGLYILGAITSLGKTSFALQIADQIAQAGQDVLIFSLEMARSELMAKSISRLTMINCPKGKLGQAKTTRGITTGKRWEKYSQAELELITSSMKHYKEYARRIYISEGMGEVGAQQIRETINQHLLFTGNTPVVLVDYLQLLAPYDPRSTDKQNTDKAVLELKRISRDYKIPVLAISSFNRQNYSSPVTMEAFKESGAIEYSSDVLIGLQAAGAGSKGFDIDAEKKKDPRHVELKILKNRNGRTGDKLYYDYYPKFNYFTETEGGLEWDSRI